VGERGAKLEERLCGVFFSDYHSINNDYHSINNDYRSINNCVVSSSVKVAQTPPLTGWSGSSVCVRCACVCVCGCVSCWSDVWLVWFLFFFACS
jgi:hypothetical protein